MDNHNNIDDILKLLKSTVENSDTDGGEIQKVNSSDASEDMSADILKEKLRKQFMQTDGSATEPEVTEDEYAIDESFVAEAVQIEEDREEIPSAPDPEDTSDEMASEDLKAIAEEEPEEIVAEEAEEIIPEAVEEETPEVIEPTLSAEDIDDIIEAEVDDDDLPWYDKMPWEDGTVSENEEPLELEEDLAFYGAAEEDDGVEELAMLDGQDCELEEDDVIDRFEEIDDIVVFEEEQSEAEQVSEPAEKAEESIVDIFRAQNERPRVEAQTEDIPDEFMSDDDFVDDDLDQKEYDFDGEQTEENAYGGTAAEDLEIEIPIFASEKYIPIEPTEEEAKNDQSDILTADFFDSKAAAREENDKERFVHRGTVEFETDSDEEELYAKTDIPTWRSVVRPIGAGLLSLLLLVLELLPIFEVELSGILDYSSYPLIYILIDIQLLVFTVLLCRKRFMSGLSRLFTESPNIQSICALTVLLSFFYSICACIGSYNGIHYLYGAPAAICLLLDCVVDVLDERYRNRAVRALASQDSVYSLVRSHGEHSCADKMYVGGVDPDKNIYIPAKVKDGDIKSAFFDESGKAQDKVLSYSLSVIFIFSAVISVLCIFFGYEFFESLNALLATFMLLVPISAIISGFLPYYIASVRLERRGCYIASERAVKKLSDCDTIVFSDTHLFVPNTAAESGIKLYANKDIRKLFACLGALYSAVGGPMKNVFAEVSDGHGADIVRIARNGIEAVVDGKTNIIVGRADYLARYGISVSSDEESNADGLSVLYVAMDATLYAKLSLNYKTQPIFEAISSMLGDSKISTAIETFDPIISSAYVTYRRENEKYHISVIHKNRSDYYNPEKRDVGARRAGVFATASRLKVAELVIACKKITQAQKISRILRIAFWVFSAAISVAMTVLGYIGNVNLLWILGVQTVFSGVLAIVSFGCIPKFYEDEK